MKRRRNRQIAVQRVILGLLGAVLTATALVGLLISSGTVDRVTSWVDGTRPLLNGSVDSILRSNSVWFQVGALAVGGLLVALGAVWLRRQIPPIRHHQNHDVPNTSDKIAGTNIVDGSAIAEALAADLERHPSIKRAIAEVRSEDNVVRLQISVADTLALPELRSSIIAPALERAKTVGQLDQALATQTDVRFVEPERALA